jgi:hypothetical protein
MTPDRAIETAADYADAMLTARSAKNLIVLLLVLMLLVQMAVLFVARYKPQWLDRGGSATGPVPAAAELSTTAASARPTGQLLAQYLTVLIDFCGVALAFVLAAVLLLIVMVMLVGRLIGVSRLTSSFILCLVLIVLVFPWQAFLSEADFRIPGVLYTWGELSRDARFGIDALDKPTWTLLVLKWVRFVVFPAAALLILLVIQAKSNRGLRQALGEGEISSTGSAI